MDHKQILQVFAVRLLCFAIIGSATAQVPDFPERMPIVQRTFSEDPDKFNFAIIGDKTGGGRDKWPVLDRAISEINSLQPDFAIMVGDLIQGNTIDLEQLRAEWEEFWQHESPLAISFLPLPGNHDITNRVMYNYWVEHVGRTYSAFTYKDCLFIILNTEERHGLPKTWKTGLERHRFAMQQKSWNDTRTYGTLLCCCISQHGYTKVWLGSD